MQQPSARRRTPGGVAAATVALMLAATVLTGASAPPAQVPPTPSGAPTTTMLGQGPRFPSLGPGIVPPEAEGPARPNSPLPAGRTARCRWDLRGAWESRGQQTDPASNTYSARWQVRQFGNYLVVDQPAENLTYYGVCSGDRVELDAYMGDTFVGMQTGTVSGNGRRIESTWVLYAPDYAAGYETLTATGRPTR